MSKYAFGVDVGGTTVKLGLFNDEGQVLDKWEIPTVKDNGGEKVLPDIAASIKNKMQEKNITAADLVGVGIGGNFEKCAEMAKQALTRELYEDGEITDYKMRVENSKLTTVRALQSIGFETVASGDSYNDLGMILAGKSGFLFRTTEQIKADYPQIPALETYEELLNALKEA